MVLKKALLRLRLSDDFVGLVEFDGVDFVLDGGFGGEEQLQVVIDLFGFYFF